MDLFSVVETGTQLVTVLLLLCGIPPCIETFKLKDTGKMNYNFCLISCTNAVIGLLYGQMSSNQALLHINLLVLVFTIPFLAVYIHVCSAKVDPVGKLIVTVFIMATSWWFLQTVIVDHDLILGWLGISMFLLSVVLWITPIEEVQNSIAKKSSDDISVPMLVGSIACCAMWFWYGLLLKDFYIYSPNIVGLITSFAKVLVLFAYNGKQAKKKQ